MCQIHIHTYEQCNNIKVIYENAAKVFPSKYNVYGCTLGRNDRNVYVTCLLHYNNIAHKMKRGENQ